MSNAGPQPLNCPELEPGTARPLMTIARSIKDRKSVHTTFPEAAVPLGLAASITSSNSLDQVSFTSGRTCGAPSAAAAAVVACFTDLRDQAIVSTPPVPPVWPPLRYVHDVPSGNDGTDPDDRWPANLCGTGKSTQPLPAA